MLFGQKSTLDVKEGSEENDDSSHADFRKQKSLTIVRLNGKHTFSHVQKSLGNTNTEEWF